MAFGRVELCVRDTGNRGDLRLICCVLGWLEYNLYEPYACLRLRDILRHLDQLSTFDSELAQLCLPGEEPYANSQARPYPSTAPHKSNHLARRATWSRPLNGSSSTKRPAGPRNAWARMSFWRFPLDKDSMRSLGPGTRPNRWSSSRLRALTAASLSPLIRPI